MDDGDTPSGADDTPPETKADLWRQRLNLGEMVTESTAEATQSASPAVRIALAREEMRRIVLDRLGGDPALLESVARMTLSGEEAVALLENPAAMLEPAHFSALEAIVAFDGSRPSFLLKEDAVDFTTSLATDNWRTALDPHLDDIRDFAACVGRVNLGKAHIGTAFLIAPTLALTNRHVVQSIADVGVDPIELFGPASLDFGHEHAGRATHDRREIKRVLFVGDREIPHLGPIDHARLDVALIEVAPSVLGGTAQDRFLPLSARTGDLPGGWLVGAVGYPGKWQAYVPESLQGRYAAVLKRLLDGDAGTKRFAPGYTGAMVEATPRWSGTHDATTINGNSGSPMAALRPGALKVSGLHYGGRWSGERTNWAHILGNCGNGTCFPGDVPLRAALASHGIAI